MKKLLLLFSFASFVFVFSSSCNSRSNNNITTDPLSVTEGRVLFDKNCGGCHNFRTDGIGPNLSGVTSQVPVDWLHRFIKEPKKVIDSNDSIAKKLSSKYKTTMPSFAFLKDEDIDHIIAYLNTHQEHEKQKRNYPDEITDPFTAKIPLSNLLVNLQLITQFPVTSSSGKPPLARITKLDYQPGTNQSFVIDLNGKLYRLDYNKPEVYMDITKLRPKFIHEPGLATGFGSFAFHPDFARNGLLYTTHTEPANTTKADFSYDDSIKVTLQWVLTEWKADDPKAATFSGTGRELFRVNMVSGIHGMQEITFNPLAKPGGADYGLLYIGVGDGGCTENGYPFLAHNKEKIWGTVLRIDPQGNNSTNGKYGIPSNNPFVKNTDPKILKEIYAYGFRNPHRITWLQSGKMLVSNVGQANIESINLIQPGNDYGWPEREGSFLIHPYDDINKVYALPSNDSIYHFTYPVVMFDHDEAKAISGTVEYAGKNISALKGKVLFGDIPTGRLFFIEAADIKQGKVAPIKEWRIVADGKQQTLHQLCGSDRVDLHFGRDAQGEIYIMTKADGKLYKLVSASNNH